MGTQLTGIASGFDWKTFVDQMIEYESAPITRMEAEQKTNTAKVSALTALDTRLTTLQSAVAALQSPDLFAARTATLASSSWSASAAGDTATGSYQFTVTQLATTSRLTGAADIGSSLSATDDVSGLTLSTLRTASAVTAGTFTVNGQQVTVDLTDSLEDLFDKISLATGGTVTATYDSGTDRISLSSGSEIILGAANDTSNFLSATRLANSGTGTITSSTALGATAYTSPLASAGLGTAITAVDGSGNGSFSINGVSIDYNVNSDSLKTVLARINSSTAGVNASYDPASDGIILVNKTTGDTGISVSETGAGLLGALGLSAGTTFSHGKNALYSLNGGATLTSTSNTLDSGSHGIAGLSITATSETTNTVTVASDASSMRTKIESFITAFNAVQSYIDDQTRITTKDDTVTTATLTDNREVQTWARTLRSTAFGAVSGLDGTITQLESLGIDFTAGTSQLTIKNSTKLDTALATNAEQVSAFFTTSSTGFAARLTTYLNRIAGTDTTKGYIDSQQDTLNKANASLDKQIADVERMLEQRRSVLEAAFIAMEEATQTQNNLQSQLLSAFGSD